MSSDVDMGGSPRNKLSLTTFLGSACRQLEVQTPGTQQLSRSSLPSFFGARHVRNFQRNRSSKIGVGRDMSFLVRCSKMDIEGIVAFPAITKYKRHRSSLTVHFRASNSGLQVNIRSFENLMVCSLGQVSSPLHLLEILPRNQLEYFSKKVQKTSHAWTSP